MLEELAVIARELGQVDAEDGPMRLLASLVAASREFIGIADLEGKALFVNEAGRKLVGLRDLKAVHSTRIIDYFEADDHRKILQEVLPAVRDTGFWEGELKFRHFETGELIPVLYNIFPVHGSSGTITAYGTVTRNLTESKLAEERLSSLASIVESSDDAIVSKNLDGVITTWNRGAERIFGYTAEEAVGRPITIVIPENRQSEEREILTRIQTRRADRPFRDHSAAQAWQLNHRFTDRFSRQKRRRQDCWSVEGREGYYRAEAKSGKNRYAGSGSGASEQELAFERTSCRQFLQF
jgi:PAS domain S-box-containing protein